MKFGRGGGSGKHSYRYRTWLDRQVQVSHMPEDQFKIRITFTEKGATCIPITVLGDTDAEMLWNALSDMAEDLKWERDKEKN